MPFGWGKKSAAPSEPAATPPTSLPSSQPLSLYYSSDGQSVRFQIERAFTIFGIGGAVSGKLESGTMTVPTELEIGPGPGSATPRAKVQVASAMLRRAQVMMVSPGMSVGLDPKGVPSVPNLLGGKSSRYTIRQGDFLGAPRS